MSKGSQQTGTSTTTTTNPTGEAQLPYLKQGWDTAQTLAQQYPYQYYPYETMGHQNALTSQGYQSMGDVAAANQGLTQGGGQIFNSAVNQGMNVNASPAFAGLTSAAAGTSAPGQYFNALAQGTTTPQQQLQRVSQGDYLVNSPEMYAAVTDPAVRAYQTATAPQTDFNFSNAGRYGSGAMYGQRSTNQQDLSRGLSNAYANIYQGERGRQDAATGNLATAMAGGATGLNSLMQNALQTLQGGYQSGNAAQLQAMQQLPQLLQAGYLGPQAMVAGGQGLTGLHQAQIDDATKRWYGQWDSGPWKTNQQYLGMIGTPVSAGGTESKPIFTNPTSEMASLLTGIGSLGSLFMSDRRLKEDDRVVGHIGDLPLHTFRYRGHPKTHLGFMADEVSQVDPGAVMDTDSGYQAVDYGRALNSALNFALR